LENFQYIKSLLGRSYIGEYDESNNSLSIQITLVKEDITHFHEWAKTGNKIDYDFIVNGETRETNSLSEADIGLQINTKIFPNDFRAIFFFLKDMEEFKSRYLVRCGTDEDFPAFYILSENYFSDDPALPEVKRIQNYKTLFSVLKDISDHETLYEFILFNECKLSIRKELDFLITSPAKVPDISIIESLRIEIEREEHREQRRSILKSILVDILFHENPHERLFILIHKINEIYETWKVSFNLYIQEFSYSVLRSEFQKNALDFFERISNTIADIRSQVIVISTSAIAMTQMTEGLSLKNVLILVSILTATVIYHQILANQSGDIKRIDGEIKRQDNLLSEKQKAFYEKECKNKFDDLYDQVNIQKKRIRLFKILLWGNFIIAFALLMYLSFFASRDLHSLNRNFL